MVDEILILAVDDDDMNVEMLDVILSDMDCKVLKAGNGREALQMLEDHPDIDIMLIDLEMPVMDGYECISQVKNGAKWHEMPVVAMSGSHYDMPRMLALRANDFISKPFNSEELRLRVMNHVRNKKLADLAKEMNSVLESEVVKKAAALKKALDLSREAEYEISLRLGRASEFRDQETGLHTRRISEFSMRLGQLAGLSDEECETLHIASPLHDVGKIGIPDRILLKQGKLDENEFDIMKLHTVIGGKILSKSERYPTLGSGNVIALQHHEKWDGSGYPHKFRGEDIHIFARIVMIVDVFDALTSERPYKKAFPLEKTISIMAAGKGEFFDPVLLDIFFKHIDEFVSIKESMCDLVGGEPPMDGLAELAMI